MIYLIGALLSNLDQFFTHNLQNIYNNSNGKKHGSERNI